MEFVCRACGRLIYNRRLKNCEFCSVELPPELVYTEEERQRVDREIKEELHRQEVALQKEQEEEEKRRKKGEDHFTL